MTDQTGTPGNPGPDQAEPEEAESVERRQVSEDELKEILEAHEAWLASDRKEGQQADLSRANLQGANLQGANLRRARGLRRSSSITHAGMQKPSFLRTLRSSRAQGRAAPRTKPGTPMNRLAVRSLGRGARTTAA